MKAKSCWDLTSSDKQKPRVMNKAIALKDNKMLRLWWEHKPKETAFQDWLHPYENKRAAWWSNYSCAMWDSAFYQPLLGQELSYHDLTLLVHINVKAQIMHMGCGDKWKANFPFKHLIRVLPTRNVTESKLNGHKEMETFWCTCSSHIPGRFN